GTTAEQETRPSERGRKARHDLTRGRGVAYPRAERQPGIRLQRRSPYGEEGTGAPCCLSGTGASPGRRGEDTRRTPAARSGPGHARAGRVYRPLAGGDMACTSPGPASTARGRRSRQRQVQQAHAVPEANGSLPCPSGDTPSVDGPGSSPGKVVRP